MHVESNSRTLGKQPDLTPNPSGHYTPSIQAANHAAPPRNSPQDPSRGLIYKPKGSHAALPKSAAPSSWHPRRPRPYRALDGRMSKPSADRAHEQVERLGTSVRVR